MSVPDFTAAREFLLGVADAAYRMADFEKLRRTKIGTGEIALAERYVIKKTAESCIYLHRWLRSDPDDLHDHPWDWCSIILAVGYWEVSESGRLWREPGSVLFRKAEERHRVEIDPEGPRPVSLFMTSTERREWGFHTPDGFIIGREYRSVDEFRRRRAESVA